jgi:hypothetical protein
MDGYYLSMMRRLCSSEGVCGNGPFIIRIWCWTLSIFLRMFNVDVSEAVEKKHVLNKPKIIGSFHHNIYTAMVIAVCCVMPSNLIYIYI